MLDHPQFCQGRVNVEEAVKPTSVSAPSPAAA